MRAGVVVEGDELVWECDTQGPVLVARDRWLRCWVDDELELVWVYDTNGWCCVPADMHAGTYGAPQAERRELHAERAARTDLFGSALGVAAVGVEFAFIAVVIAVLLSGVLS